jgi:beta-ribofuranosylaminobenzene 5'-phosphate synthase
MGVFKIISKDSNGVNIQTPARLHFSLIDLNGELGRIDGGIGVAISKPNWDIKIERSGTWSKPGYIQEPLEAIKKQMNPKDQYKITIHSELPIHVGLGSQTQLSLALAHGISKLEGKEYEIKDLARMVGRGGTSGIGVAAYEYGGFIFDGGHSVADKSEFLPSHFSSAKPAVLIQRIEVPEDWYFVVAIPDVGKGKYGTEEVEIFKNYCPIPAEEVNKLSRIILMQMLPAIVEDDIDQFGRGLNSIQNIGFKRIENELQHEFIKKLQEFYLNTGASGTGLSSFGPATFCMIRSKSAAIKLAAETEKYIHENDFDGPIFSTPANNSGAMIVPYTC